MSGCQVVGIYWEMIEDSVGKKVLRLPVQEKQGIANSATSTFENIARYC